MNELFTDKVKKYSPRLEADLKISHINSCGIFGNIGAETGGFKFLQEIKPVVKGSRGGLGWLQWTGPRRRRYEAWCMKNSFNTLDDESNYKYLVYESLNDEYHSIEQIRKTNTLEASTETFMKSNLRPGAPHLDSRINWAHIAFDATKAASVTTPVVVKEVKKPSTTAITTTATTVGTGAVVVATQPHLWPYVVGVVGLVIVGYVVYRYFQWRNSQKKS